MQPQHYNKDGNKMRTIRTKVYKFCELSEQAKEAAIENLKDVNVNYDWSKFILEEKANDLAELGFMDATIYYSGFWSQGDGACFICKYIDFAKFMNGKYASYAEEISCTITHNYMYYFAASTDVDLNDEANTIPDDLYSDILADIKRERERIGNEIYSQLEDEYEYQTGKDAIIEAIEANEYEFTSDGRMI